MLNAFEVRSKPRAYHGSASLSSWLVFPATIWPGAWPSAYTGLAFSRCSGCQSPWPLGSRKHVAARRPADEPRFAPIEAQALSALGQSRWRPAARRLPEMSAANAPRSCAVERGCRGSRWRVGSSPARRRATRHRRSGRRARSAWPWVCAASAAQARRVPPRRAIGRSAKTRRRERWLDGGWPRRHCQDLGRENRTSARGHPPSRPRRFYRPATRRRSKPSHRRGAAWPNCRRRNRKQRRRRLPLVVRRRAAAAARPPSSTSRGRAAWPSALASRKIPA